MPKPDPHQPDPSESGTMPGALTYAAAGVDIDAGNAFVERIRPHVARTRRPGVLGGIGGFGGLFELPEGRYRRPVFVSGADGVGTKLRIAIELGRHDTIGIDLVAMCANDILVCGAEPLWFLDYYASGSLDVDVATAVVSGIAEGCVQAGMALLGGETAEMPGHYAAGDYDLAGFAVGVVEKDAIVDGSTIAAGDSIIGLESSGPHSNGYSLIRRVLEHAPADVLERPVTDVLGGSMNAKGTLGDALLAPTRIYVPSVRALLPDGRIKAMAHITGGGLTDNLPRVLPDTLVPRLDAAALTLPPLFAWLARIGGIDSTEMQRTFNCGIGFALVVAGKDVEAVLGQLAGLGEAARVIGTVADR